MIKKTSKGAVFKNWVNNDDIGAKNVGTRKIYRKKNLRSQTFFLNIGAILHCKSINVVDIYLAVVNFIIFWASKKALQPIIKAELLVKLELASQQIVKQKHNFDKS